MTRRISGALVCTALLILVSSAIHATPLLTLEQFRAKVTEATKNFKDLSMTGTVTYKNKEALTKIEANYAQLYEFKTAYISLKHPDKVRIEGKLGMVKFEYIVNGTNKLFRAPMVKISKKDNYADEPAKLQSALDVGIVTPTLWQYRTIEIIDDEHAQQNGEIKLRMRWAKGDMVYYAWIDAKDLYLKKFEKCKADGTVELRTVYSDAKKVSDAIWIPHKVEVYASDGTKAGTSEFSDVKVNSGLADSLFE